MSKRAEEVQASAILPESIISYAKEHAVLSGLVYREGVKYGYEQAEKDMYDSLLVFLKEKYREYSNNGELKERNTIIKVIDELNKFMYE